MVAAVCDDCIQLVELHLGGQSGTSLPGSQAALLARASCLTICASCHKAGLREDICVWICTDTLLLVVNLLQRIQIVGGTLVPSSWRASASLTANAC